MDKPLPAPYGIKFQVGDRVTVDPTIPKHRYTYPAVGKRGSILYTKEDDASVLVEFDEPIEGGYSGGLFDFPEGKEDCCLWIWERELVGVSSD